MTLTISERGNVAGMGLICPSSGLEFFNNWSACGVIGSQRKTAQDRFTTPTLPLAPRSGARLANETMGKESSNYAKQVMLLAEKPIEVKRRTNPSIGERDTAHVDVGNRDRKAGCLGQSQ